ncbi:MAG: hypothetical protein AB8F95_09260 [Bacteroidia bacterium]
MIKRLLLIKHWQLFVLLFVLPMIGYMWMMLRMMMGILERQQPGFGDALELFPFILIPLMTVFLGWLWSIGKGLQDKIPEEFRLDTKWFQIAIIYSVAYYIVFAFAMSWFMDEVLSQVSFPTSPQSPFGPSGLLPSGNPAMMLIVPFHFLAIGCMFYSMFFAGKTLKTAELKRKVDLSDFVLEFMLFWFYPVGVWFIQPKVNTLAKSEIEES